MVSTKSLPAGDQGLKEDVSFPGGCILITSQALFALALFGVPLPPAIVTKCANFAMNWVQ